MTPFNQVNAVLRAAAAARLASTVWSNVCNRRGATDPHSPDLRVITEPTPEERVLMECWRLALEDLGDRLAELGPPTWSVDRMRADLRALIERAARSLDPAAAQDLARRTSQLVESLPEKVMASPAMRPS